MAGYRQKVNVGDVATMKDQGDLARNFEGTVLTYHILFQFPFNGESQSVITGAWASSKPWVTPTKRLVLVSSPVGKVKSMEKKEDGLHIKGEFREELRKYFVKEYINSPEIPGSLEKAWKIIRELDNDALVAKERIDALEKSVDALIAMVFDINKKEELGGRIW